jgi:hypothetical protein
MIAISPKRSFAALAAIGALLVAAAPAGAIAYNGHAGLGASYQHNQTDLEFLAVSPSGANDPVRTAAVQDGTSNTIMVGVFSAGKPGEDVILMADMGGQIRAGTPR